MAPRMMALPWPANPKDTSCTPSYSVGVMARVSGFMRRMRSSGLTIVGRLGPYTSASKMPTWVHRKEQHIKKRHQRDKATSWQQQEENKLEGA